MTRPNVLFILADDLGFGDLSCFNHGVSQTPNLDALLRECVVMSQHYSASPICAPARAALMTGRYPQRCGVIDTISAGEMNCLATRETTMAELFRAAGYATGLIGKWHLGHVGAHYHPTRRGFDEHIGFRGGNTPYYNWTLEVNGHTRGADGRYLTDVLTQDATEFLARHRDEPFFLYLAYNAPHGPFEAPEEDIQPFRERGAFTERVSTLYAMVKRLDIGIGRVLEKLDRLGLRENTIVVFSSDNGPQFSGEGERCTARFNCGFRGSKGSVHEGGIRVPLMIRWPAGLEGGRDYHDVVHFADWLPTLTRMCNVHVPEGLALDGQSVLLALRGEGHAKLNPKRFWQFSRSVPVVTHNAAMRDGDWKLVRPGDRLVNSFEGWREDLQAEPGIRGAHGRDDLKPPPAVGRPLFLGKDPDPPLLFNLANDPLETCDLSACYPDIARRMLRELENWFEDVERDRRSIPNRQYRTAQSLLNQ
ncbi:MAG: sulfatase-like hydrolase/transferase [Phycisphaera sp.]|nr:sulfatase-like hydrolase/transferase [Phycisphaera sp.]